MGTRHTQLSPASEGSVTKSTLTLYQFGELTKIDTVRDYQRSFHVTAENPQHERACRVYSQLGCATESASHKLSNSANLRDCAELRSHVLMSGK